MFNFRRFKALFNPDALPPFERAMLDLDSGRPQEALERFDALLAGNPSPVERVKIANKRGIALVKLGRREEALAEFTAVLELDPQYAPALVNIGNLCLEDGNIDDAIVHYEAAIRADDQYPVAHMNLGVAYKRMGRLGDSVRELKRATRLEGRIRPKKSK